MYKRKTRDIYVLVCNYGYGDGWEVIEENENPQEVKRTKKDYLKNMPQYLYRIIKKRVKA